MIKHLIKIDGELFEIPLKVYNHLEQQKQRADELEKRWSELKERMEHDEKEAFGEGDVIAYTVHNYVLELMRDLEEDNNARSK
ncbi:hypothetical protein MACA111363_11220 [Macrococcoides canis]|uniref:Uncharacterized protein n=1 Tax=Macrococcoides canis TaxID=1855823 RepID=A0A1W7AD07_9STAP|nr:hypothetical protein MCCS_16690 [Macrococcus canis]